MKKTLTLSLLATLCLAGSLRAQSHRDTITHQLDSVSVYGRLNVEPGINPLGVSVKKLPLTISTLAAPTLQERAIVQVPDALRFVPAVQTKSTYGAFREISVRGFYNTVYMIDGIRDERSTVNSYPLGDLYNVESIEVLKGPASVLYGYAATGGVVNITRRMPTDKFSLGAHIRGGSLGYFDLGANVGGKIAEGLNFYAGGFLSGGKQWRSTHDKNRSLFAALSYTKGAHSLVLRLEGRNDFYGTDAGLAPVMPGDMYRVSDGQLHARQGELLPGTKRDWRYNDASDFMYNRAYNGSLKYTFAISPSWKLADYVSYAYDDIDYFSTEELAYPTSTTAGAKYKYFTKDASGAPAMYYDLDHVQYTFPLRFSHIAKTLQNTLDLTGNFYLGAVRNNLRFAYSTTYLQRTTYNGYDGLDVQGGGRTFDSHGNVLTYTEIPSFEPNFNGHMTTRFSAAIPQHTWVHGFALSNVFELSDALKAMAAVRYDLYSYRSAYTQTLDGKRRYDDPAKSDYSKSSDGAISYRVGLVYQPTEALSFYSSLGSFYIPDKTTSFNPSSQRFYSKDGKAITERNAGGAYFDPQSGYQFEVGTKYTLSDVLQLNLSAYHIRRNNELARTTINVQENGQNKRYSVTAQVGATEGNGFEADLTYRPLAGLELVLGYSYTDIHVGDAKQTDVTSLLNIRTGTPLAWVPRKQFFSYGHYAFQSRTLAGLSLNYSLSYRDAMYYNVGRGDVFPALTQLGLGASYRLPKGFTLSAQVRNVLNAKNYTSVLGGSQLFPNEPTNVLVTLSYSL